MDYTQGNERRLLVFHCLFTCTYYLCVLGFLKFNEHLYDMGSFKFIPILLILMLAEVAKLLILRWRRTPPILGIFNVRTSNYVKKSYRIRLRETATFFLVLVLLFVIYFIAILLFGAPLLEQHAETSTLALTLAALTFVPARLHLGMDKTLLILTTPHVRSTGLLGEAASLVVKSTLMGAWLGAIAIPLDWDRPWQIWPVPCVLGAIAGHVFGNLLTLTKLSSASITNKD